MIGPLTTRSRSYIALLTVGPVLCVCSLLAQEKPTVADVNLAVVASPSTSFVSGHETLNAINDGFEPADSNDTNHGEYGNWPQQGTQWVQYDWSQPISTRKIDVYWWNDQRGVRIPKACRLLFWDGQAFVPVPNVQGLGLAEHQYNTTTFDEVETTRLRLEVDASGTFSTGILEWKVYDSGNSPPFPPVVHAGVDRVAMTGGKTYLRGTYQMLASGHEASEITWSKVAGPGDVTFGDLHDVTTTAVCSQPGEYQLQLTVGNGSLQSSSSLTVQAVQPPPAQHLQLIDTGRYTIESTLWNDRAKSLIVHWIPHCIRQMTDPELKEGGINNFEQAARKLAGQPHEPHRGYVFSNAWVYNTMESICIALMVDAQGDQEVVRAQQQMQATLDDWIPKIMAAQEPDGYIQTVFTLNDWPHWSPDHRADHEGYVAGYLLEAAIAHSMLTGGRDTRLYDTAKRLADCWERNIGPPPKRPWYDGHQAMEIALVRFGRYVNRHEGAGSGDKYIALAKFLLDCRREGSEYDQSHVPVIEQYTAVGHAVRASYSYAAMADVAMETGDVDYQSAVMSLWDNLINRKYYVTGGIGSGETSEGFGPDYSLPQNAYCESCSSCGEIFFQHKLCLTYHNAQFADLYEETLYNALLGSVDLAGENFYYQNPLDEHGKRYPWHVCPCCVGNIPRTLLMLPTWMYAKDQDSLYVNLFVGSTVEIQDVAGTNVTIQQQTDYPWSGTVVLTVSPQTPTQLNIRIRVPQHDVSKLYTYTPDANGITSLSVNSQSVAPEIVNGYAVISRTWTKGDQIELKLPMDVQRVKGDERIEATRGRVALRRGPLIYAFEEVDQDPNRILDDSLELTQVWRSELLRGITTLEGKWTDGANLVAIPYYARNNRLPKTESGDNNRRGRRSGSLSRVWMRDQ